MRAVVSMPAALVLLAATAAASLAQGAAPAGGSRIEVPAGPTPIVVVIPGPTRWVLTERQQFTPVGADSGKLTVYPAYEEAEGGNPNCVEMIDHPSDGVAVVRAHAALPTSAGWHPAANTAGDMLIACLMLRDLRVLFEIRGTQPSDAARLKPLLQAYGDAAIQRFGAAASR